jgi:hypothetical protein
MATPKKKPAVQTSAKLKDLKPKKNPKGGAFDAYLKLDDTYSQKHTGG